MSVPNRRYSTGMHFLDSRLDGGLPVGTLLSITAPASSQSELLLYHFATTRPMLYISTTHSAEVEVRSAIDQSAIPSPNDLTFAHIPPDELLSDPETYLNRIRPESFVVIDPIDGLERGDHDQYATFINKTKEQLRKTDSIGIFHSISTNSMSTNRRLTQKRADYVWRLEQLILSREIKTRLLITKARRGRALSEPISLVISDHVRVDTSRRIS